MNRAVPPLMSRLLALALLVLVIGFVWIVIVEPIRADFENQETRMVLVALSPTKKRIIGFLYYRRPGSCGSSEARFPVCVIARTCNSR